MMVTPEDRHVRVGQINARYWADGNQGSPVILVHGLGGYIENWAPGFATLAAQHQVYAVDLPGHGKTDKPQSISYTIESLSRFIKDFMTALGIEKAHIVGHSLGGAIGTRLVLTQAAAVDRLVLVSSAGLGREIAAMLRIISIPILGELLTRPSLSGSENLTKMLVYNQTVATDEIIELAYQMSLLPNSQKSFLKASRANINLFGQKKSMYGPNVQGLPSITKPVLVVWGRQDQIVPVAHAEVAARYLADVRVHIFDNCGHIPMLESTIKFNRVLLDFLSCNDA